MIIKPKIIIITYLTLIYSSSTIAGDVLHSKITYENEIYKASLEMQIEAPVDKVYSLFTDFNHLSLLSDNITNSLLLEEDPPEYIVEIETYNCIMFFCKSLMQTQHVLELEGGYISVEDITGESDFIFANTVWHIRAFEKGTRVSFNAEMKPDFWLPPILGPWLFKNKMISNTKAMIEKLEQLASDK